MPIPTSISDLSTTAASNSPQGSESPTEGDNYIRALSAIVAQEHAAFAASTGAAGVGCIQTGTGAVARTLQDKSRDVFNARDYGASSGASTATNKAALQAAITAASAASLSSGNTATVVVLDNYGYVTTTRSTWPSFTGISGTVIVLDYTKGNTYAGFPTAYDGSQSRAWMHTPQTTSLGQHDGNTFWQRGPWAPNYCISNDMDLTGARLATDNRRGRLTYFNDGEATWSVGQGTLNSSTATNEELSNFAIEKYAAAGDTLGAVFSLVIERKTLNWGINVGTNTPQFGIHFKSAVTGFQQMCLESLTTTSDLVLRNSNGSGDDVYLRNAAGQGSIRIASQGDAITFGKADRRVTITQALVRKRVSVVYSASMTLDAATGNFFTIVATNNTAFAIAITNPADGQQITVRISNTAGVGLGAATWTGIKIVGTSWTQPATGFNRSIVLEYDGASWNEVSRSSGDVPN